MSGTNGLNDGTRVALVHDYLTQFGGAEQVLGALQRLFPAATTFTTLHDEDADLPGVTRNRIEESFLGRVRWLRQNHRAALPLFPLAMRDLNRRLTDFDLVIADTSAWAHQITPRPHQTFLVYCHSPARFLYGDPDYLGATGVTGWRARAWHVGLGGFRWLDRRAYQRANLVLANSNLVARRLADCVGVAATVLHPPIDVDRFVPLDAQSPEDWYLVVSRLVPHKQVELVVRTANAHGLAVKIIGTGRDTARLKALSGPTVEFLGFRPHHEVIEYFRRCRAFILPGVEDFGMTAVEAQAAGRPVIAVNKGGARETVIDGRTGVLFDHHSPDALVSAMKRLDSLGIDPATCIAHARSFDEPVFREGILAAIKNAQSRTAL